MFLKIKNITYRYYTQLEMDKTILLASFIFPERLDWYINYLDTKFGIQRDRIFCFKNLTDDSKLILTFKLVIKDSKHINLKNLFPNAIIVHKKQNAYYTINALNKLIESKMDGESGNIDHKSYRVNWDEYQNKLILIDNNDLVIHDIKRIF